MVSLSTRVILPFIQYQITRTHPPFPLSASPSLFIAIFRKAPTFLYSSRSTMSSGHLLFLSRRTRPILLPPLWTQTTRSSTTQPTTPASKPPPEPAPPPPTAMIYDRLAESVKSKLKRLENPDPNFLRYGSPHPIVTDYSPILRAPETRVTTLPNGLRVATESNLASKTAAVAVWVDAGSRYEADDAEGVAHLLEHMIFKGTEKRDEKKLAEEVENIGGFMHARTTREQTEYRVKVMMNNADNAIEILADALQNSVFDEKKLDREKGVILHEREKGARKDEDVIFDHLHATAFQYTPLGRTIIGSVDNIMKITKAQIQDYLSNHYATHRVVISVAGAVKHEDIVEQVKKHFTKLSSNPETTSQLVARRPAIFTGSEIRMIDDDLPVAQFAVAFEVASWTDPDSIALMVMKVMLGSWNKKEGAGKHMGSELVQRVAINEIAESMGAFNLNYKDTGLFGVYAEAKPDCLDDLAYSIMYEMSKFCYRVSEADVTRARNQLKSSLILLLNGSGFIADDIGFQLIKYGRRIPFAELFARIDAVDATTVKRVANRFIFDQDIAISAKGPIQGLPDYNWFRRRTYWLRY